MKLGNFGVFGAGVPACADLGKNEEQFECYTDFRGRRQCQYDYRNFDGELFSCVRPSLEDCVRARDAWLIKNKEA